MPASNRTDAFSPRIALGDNRRLHLGRPLAPLARARKHLEPLRALAHRIITRDYHSRTVLPPDQGAETRRYTSTAQGGHGTALTREINEGLNVVETWNSANGFIFFGRGGEVASNRLDEQQTSVAALHLLQSCLVYVNTLMLQRVLAEERWRGRMTAADERGLTRSSGRMSARMVRST